MSTTPLSLLDRLRKAPPNSADWDRLQTIYLPLIRSRLRRVPAIGDEADDLAQEVLLVLFRALPTFQRQRDGSFRAWMQQIIVNRIRAFQKKLRKRPQTGDAEMHEILMQLEDPNSELSRQWDQDHDRHVSEHLLAIVKPDFTPTTWEAFSRFALDGRPAAAVAQELRMSESAIIQAKFRVLKRLREEAGDLID